MDSLFLGSLLVIHINYFLLGSHFLISKLCIDLGIQQEDLCLNFG